MPAKSKPITLHFTLSGILFLVCRIETEFIVAMRRHTACVKGTVHCAEIHTTHSSTVIKSGAAERAQLKYISADASLAAARQICGATSGGDTRPRALVWITVSAAPLCAATKGVTGSSCSRATISGATHYSSLKTMYLANYALRFQRDHLFNCTILFTCGAIQRVFGKRKLNAEPRKQ
jgi:hypothetical protein